MSSARLLTENDRGQLLALLEDHANTSLFMLSNIELSGIDYQGKRFNGRYWGWFEDDQLRAVVVQFWNGIVSSQGDGELVEKLWHQQKHLLDTVYGFVGNDNLCKLIRRRFDHDNPDVNYSLDSQERLYELNLSKLKLPNIAEPADYQCKLVTADDAEFLVPWMVDYNIEAIGETLSDKLIEQVAASVVSKIEQKNTYALWYKKRPVATTGFNAKTRPFVQVGGVWTPVEYRSKGFARRAVAMSLLDVRDQGFTQSVLFTDVNNIGAQKAYESLGYEHVGEFGLYMIDVN